jgi:hypothetical protein
MVTMLPIPARAGELEGSRLGLNMSTMTKKHATKSGSLAKPSRVGNPKIAGKTSDGVIVLRAKAKPTHFTAKQIRETIQRTGLALSDKSTARR